MFEDLKNDERFIYYDEKYKKFTNKQPLEDFEKGFAEKRPFPMIPIKLPEKDNKKHFKASFERLRGYLIQEKENRIKIEIEKTLARVEETYKYSEKIQFYDDEIKRLDCLIFLQKKYGIKMKRRKLIRPETSASSSEQKPSSSSSP